MYGAYKQYKKTRVSMPRRGFLLIFGDEKRIVDTNYTNESEPQLFKIKKRQAKRYADVNKEEAANNKSKYCITTELLATSEMQTLLAQRQTQLLNTISPWRYVQTQSTSANLNLTNAGTFFDLMASITRGSAYNQYEGLGLRPLYADLRFHVHLPSTPATTYGQYTLWRIVIGRVDMPNSEVNTKEKFWSEGSNVTEKSAVYGCVRLNVSKSFRLYYDMLFPICIPYQGGEQRDITVCRSSNQFLSIKIPESVLDDTTFDSVGNVTNGGLIAWVFGSTNGSAPTTPSINLCSSIKYRTG